MTPRPAHDRHTLQYCILNSPVTAAYLDKFALAVSPVAESMRIRGWAIERQRYELKQEQARGRPAHQARRHTLAAGAGALSRMLCMGSCCTHEHRAGAWQVHRRGDPQGSPDIVQPFCDKGDRSVTLSASSRVFRSARNHELLKDQMRQAKLEPASESTVTSASCAAQELAVNFCVVKRIPGSNSGSLPPQLLIRGVARRALNVTVAAAAWTTPACKA